MISLSQRLLAELMPALVVPELMRDVHRHLDVPALQGETEAQLVILDKVQRHFWKALLLQVRDDGLAAEVCAPHHLHDVSVPLLFQRKLELGLRRVNLQRPRAAFAVHAEELVAVDLGHVHRRVQRANDPAVPVGEGILDEVRRGVDEDLLARIPGSGLDAHGLGDRRLLLEVPVAEDHGVLRQQCHLRAVLVPHDVLDAGHLQLAEHAAGCLLEQRDAILGPHQDAPADSSEEEEIRGCLRRREALHFLVLEILHNDLPALVQNGEAIPRQEHGAQGAPASRVALLRALAAKGVSVGIRQQVVGAALLIGEHQHVGFRRIEVVVQKSPRTIPNARGLRAARSPERDNGRVAAGAKVMLAQVAVLHIGHAAPVDVVGRPFPLQFEDDHSGVMAGCQKVLRRVGAKDPEAVLLASERLDAEALADVPDPDGSVLRVRQDELVLRMEDDARHVVRVPPHGVHLPRLGLVVPPELDLSIVRSTDHERQGMVEGSPVDAAVVGFEDVLHHRVGAPEEVCIHASHHAVVIHGGGAPHVLLAQARGVPHADGLVERGRHDEVILRVEGRAHDVVVVPSKHVDAHAGLPIPNPDGLVVAGADDPRVLIVELHGADVVQVPEQREETAPQLVVPHLDLVVVASGHDERLRAVEVHASDRSVVLVELLQKRPHAVVPQLDDAIVKGRKDPGPHRVEGQSLDAVALRLELRQHGSGVRGAPDGAAQDRWR
mmetsp:Transcript_4767/g.19100  ORF Transcript_4767/g.19100 Transcript_4767/m.19100 type:complete len:720 (-) Transcript_4767:150-2309(-)